MEATKAIGIQFTRGFQFKYCLVMFVSLAATSLLIYLYFRHGLGESYSEALATLAQVEASLPAALLVTFIVQSLLILLLSIAINLFVSHKIAGPIFRFEHTLHSIAAGDLQHVARIRDSDQIKSMVAVLNRLIASLCASYLAVSGVAEDLDRIIRDEDENDPAKREELRQRIAEARRHLGGNSDGRVDE